MLIRALLALALSSATVPQELLVKPRLVAGDEFTLEITSSREDSARPLTNYSAKTPVTVKVIKASKEGFVIDWRPGSGTVEGPGAATDPAIVTASRLLGDVTIRIALGPDGDFENVVNEAELLPRIQALIDNVLQEASRTLASDQAEKANALMKQLFSPATLIAVLSKDAQTYLGLYGVELARGEMAEAELEQPNPFGGDPLPALYQVKLAQLTPEAGTFEVHTTFDGDALMKMTLAMIEKAGGPKPPPEEVAKLRIDMIDEARVVFDRKVGLISEVNARRGISAAGSRRTDRTVIKLVSPPRR